MTLQELLCVWSKRNHCKTFEGVVIFFKIAKPRSQMVRHEILILAFAGSTPAGAAIQICYSQLFF